MTRGIRNKNPGNMEPGGWEGEQGTDGRFAVFVTMEKGIRALARQLRVYENRHGRNTIRKAINAWAPPSENHTDGYVAFVANMLEVAPDAILDFDDHDTLWWLTVAIMEEENGHAAVTQYIPDAVISAGIDDALSRPIT
jgi:hypothetical protein